MQIPTDWKMIDLDGLQGLILVIGGPDVGKSTFSRFLYERLRAQERQVAYLDGDPGQSTLGPPTTMTLSMPGDEKGFPPQGTTWRWFVGSTSPAGHMLPLIVGTSRLVQQAQAAGAEVIIYDTTGLVGPAMGGDYLKMAKINLLQPSLVVAIQRNDELKGLLLPLKGSARAKVLEISCPSRARGRDSQERQRYRADQYRKSFQGADRLTLHWPSFAVFPEAIFEPQRLVALEDQQGFVLGLGIVRNENRSSKEVTLITTLRSADHVDLIHVGDIQIDLGSFRDQQV